MRYSLIEKYFETDLFQNTVQQYFNTVLAGLFTENIILQAKGKFEINGKLIRDYFDMPYHIHILNGLIPSLLIYEKYLLTKNWIDQPQTENYLKVFILGFTFHDTNKLLKTESLQEGIKLIEEKANHFRVKDFFSDFDRYKSDIFFLSLSTENRTSVLGNHYKTNLEYSHIKDVLTNLCHFADGLASIQEFENIEALYASVTKCFNNIPKLTLPISFVEIRPNPYTLLGQNLLQNARKILAKNNKKVLFATRQGFIFFGEDVTEIERKDIYLSFCSEDDVSSTSSTIINAEKCSIGILRSKTDLQEIVEEKKNDFLMLSPNSKEKILNYQEFLTFNEKFIKVFDAPILIKANEKQGNFKLLFSEVYSDWHEKFIQIFCLHKILWLRREGQFDFNLWLSREQQFYMPITFNNHELLNIEDLVRYMKSVHSSKWKVLLKVYLNIVKTFYSIFNGEGVIKEDETIEAYLNDLEEMVFENFNVNASISLGNLDIIKADFFNKYFSCKGFSNVSFIENYKPIIPTKSKMCAFTGGTGTNSYQEKDAFGMKATGFTNRTVATLNNKLNHTSDLVLKENQLRRDKYPESETNLIVYSDFFETFLPIDKDILKACEKAKNLSLIKEKQVFVSQNAHFDYDLFLQFTKITSKKISYTEGVFFFVKEHILMLKELGIRSYVTGIMSPYIPHKEAFRFENPPKFLQMLQWDTVRLNEVESVLNEMNLIYSLGKDRLNSNLLRIAGSRNAYFTIFYLLPETEKDKISVRLQNFITKNKNKFRGMTVTETLVALAVDIDLGYKSGSAETWLIRAALDYLRKNVKQNYDREQTIQQIAGNIYKTLRQENPDAVAIEKFATAVYDELYVKEWKEQLPNLNREKDWIYQFGFLYSRKSKELIIPKSDAKIKKQLVEKNLEITKENITSLLKGTNQEYYTEQIIERILNSNK